MGGNAAADLLRLLRSSSCDPGQVIDCFIRGYNASRGFTPEGRWEIGKEDWQRYEFLGDQVLDLLVAKVLFAAGDRVMDEGEMTRILSSVVSNRSLDALLRRTCPEAFCRLIPPSIGGQDTYGERITGGALEAFIGALYDEAGLDAASQVLTPLIRDALERYDPQENAIGILQERYQKLGREVPVYTEISREGPDHRPTFTVEVMAPDGRRAWGSGPNLPDARQAAARGLLRALGERGAD